MATLIEFLEKDCDGTYDELITYAQCTSRPFGCTTVLEDDFLENADYLLKMSKYNLLFGI